MKKIDGQDILKAIEQDIEEVDVYEDDDFDELVEEDVLKPSEAAFMRGWRKAL